MCLSFREAEYTKGSSLSDELSLHLLVDGNIQIPAGPGLEALKDSLHRALTFENNAWRRKMENGLPVDDVERYRHAYTVNKDKSWSVARGAWKILTDIAKAQQVTLHWDSQATQATERQAEYTFDATLRPYQQGAVQALLRARSGVIVIPTGGGKTMVAMGIAHALQTQTLFVVHTRELLKQTAASIERILGVEPGIIGGGEWRPAPFTVALIQTLARRDLTELSDMFGLVIVDEAHHAPAQSYCQVLPSFLARYRVALTATPYRKDGLHELLWLQFGEIVYRIGKRDLEQHGRLLSPRIFPITTEFNYIYDNDFTPMISALTSNSERHKLVVETIVDTHRPGGCSLVVTERVKHAQSLYQSLRDHNLPVVLLHGKLTAKVREEAMERLQSGDAEILVATLSLIGEGWDHPPLDTLYLTVPNGNRTKTTQALGRVLRPFEGKPEPRVYDFVDYQIGILRHHWMIRARAYGLDTAEVRAALKLPPEQPPPPPQPEIRMPKNKLLDMMHAVQEGNFDTAETILNNHAPKKK
ncbi:MAG: DEAD/DEAH box helicase [Deltaproteobacteria bacterium]|nr:MAG: DEAD/DEAH box helicase [Deltaproteobacteria bacterium]